MFIEKFDEYLNHYKITKTDEEYSCKKGKVYFRCEKYSKYNEALLARAYFNIIDVSIDAVEGSVKYFTVTVEWKGIKKKDNEEYYIILYRNDKIWWNDIKAVLENFGEPQEKFYRLCSDYLKHVLTYYWQQYKKQPYIGWSGGDGDSFKTFLGVNEYGDALNVRYPCLFNNDIGQWKKKHDWQESDFQEVFDWLLGDYNLLGIFVYTLHALLFYYSGGMKNEMESEEAFSICIHGRDMDKVRIIANLLSNLFEYSNDKMHILKRGSYLSCSSLDKKKGLFYRIESVPLIVSNKAERLTRSSSIITTLRNQRLKGEIAYFPVFLSQNAIKADEVLDFCVDGIPVRSNYGDWKAKINYLLIQLIIYLEDVEENYDKKLHAAKNTLDDRYITEESRLRPYKNYMSNEAYSKRLLFVACNIFWEFLETEMQYSYIASRFLSTTRELFWADATSKQTFVSAAKEININSFAAFINATLEKEEQAREFLCVRQNEKNSDEWFIYIDYKEYYSHYKNYCQVNHKDCLEHKVILKCLKEKNILKQRSNGGQYYMQKTLSFQDKKDKMNVLVIKEEAFKPYQNDG